MEHVYSEVGIKVGKCKKWVWAGRKKQLSPKIFLEKLESIDFIRDH